ncbi:hypothetical protein M8C21_019384, partial [Ambrosia artemisiifolia]
MVGSMVTMAVVGSMVADDGDDGGQCMMCTAVFRARPAGDNADRKAVALEGTSANTSDDTSDMGVEGSWLFTKFAPTGVQCCVGDATADLSIGVEKATVASDPPMRSVVLAIGAANAPIGAQGGVGKCATGRGRVVLA